MIINFDALKATDPGLYTIITNRVGLAFIGQYEFQPVEFAALTPAIRRRLSEWAVLHPATTVIDKPVPPPRDYAAEDRAALKQDIQRTTDESRGLARLRQFQTEQGLRDCKENADAIRDWLDANCKGYVSQDMIDAAVLNLGARGKNVLLWDDMTPPAQAPEPPPEPTEVLEPWQLPITADEYAMKKATVKALLDLNLRRRKLTNQMYVGKNQRGFGTTL